MIVNKIGRERIRKKKENDLQFSHSDFSFNSFTELHKFNDVNTMIARSSFHSEQNKQ